MSAMAILSPVLLVVLLAAAFGLAGARALRLWRELRAARSPEGWSEDLGERTKRFFVYVLGQWRMLRWPYAGLLHVLIFYGFIALLTAILQGILEAAFVDFRFDKVPGAGAIALLQDTFYVAVMAGVALALFQRFVVNPDRFRGSHRSDAILILAWIAALVTAMELDYATKIAQGAPEAMASWRPVASLLARLFEPLGAHSTALAILHGTFFWLHLALVFGFLVYLGRSKHLHIVTAAPNVFFASTKPAARLKPIDIEAVMEASESNPDVHFGVATLAEFSQKDVLDWYTCTECGRCQAHCPAFNTGKPLSPKTLITDLRDNLYENLAGGYAKTTHDAFAIPGNPHVEPAATMWVTGDHCPHTRRGLPGHFQPSWLSPDDVAKAVKDGQRPLFGGTIDEETLWACTTCGACMDQCPVFIEHVPKIIDMRRALVLDESRMPRQAETALRNIENVANPYGLPQDARVQWARELDVPLLSEKKDAEYVYWMGCAASFDDRARTISSNLVKILKAAKVDFAILGGEEKCTGDPARRIGNEYLFQERAKENVETLNRYSTRKVIASCPHCFNTIANEYPDFGGNYEVIHHTQLIDRLLADGRIRLTKPLEATLTYHDSCYIGRWNGVFAPPRDILERIPGLKLVEMAKSGREGMCCGAGGGRMWMEESKPRVNHTRVQQAAATEASKVATACPFCLAMFDEGIAGQQLGERLSVDDIAVYVAQALGDEPGPSALSEPAAQR
jgi:Fe-S oxidoreductase